MKNLDFFISWLDKKPFRLYLLMFLLFGLVRIAILPWNGIGIPDGHDELSYLLQAETFALGRLSTPPPPHWEHFESFHILQNPSYASKYPPGQAFFLFLGIKFFGHPWYGVLLSCMLMVATMVWMIRGYVDTKWSLLAGFFIITQFALLNYWSSSYWGGSVAAIGGALLFGAVPRLKSTESKHQVLAALSFAVGLIVMSQTRPLEGFVISIIPVLYFMFVLYEHFKNKEYQNTARLLFPVVPLMAALIVFIGYYNFRITGDPLTMPYQLHHEQYGLQAPVFLLDNNTKTEEYNHTLFTRYYQQWELITVDSALAFLKLKKQHFNRFIKFYFFWPFLVGLVIAFAYSDKLKIPILSMVLLAGLFLFFPWFHPHYFAPAQAIYYLLLVVCVKYLIKHQKNFIRTAARISLPVLLILTVFNLNFFNNKYPGYFSGNYHFVHQKQLIYEQLAQSDLKHLVLVEYSEDHPLYEEWVYNSPEIESSKVIWARSMSPAKNKQLRDYYSDRKVWILQPDHDDFQLEVFNQ